MLAMCYGDANTFDNKNLQKLLNMIVTILFASATKNQQAKYEIILQHLTYVLSLSLLTQFLIKTINCSSVLKNACS